MVLQSGSHNPCPLPGTNPARHAGSHGAFTASRKPPSRARCSRLSSSKDDEGELGLEDPEARFKRYGKDFGKRYVLDTNWIRAAPRVRTRTVGDRAVDQLADLAVLNERLAGNPQPWEIRRRLEYLKTRRRQWELIYSYVTQSDAAATLAAIEEANKKVEEALSERSRECTSVGALKQQLTDLQQEVHVAHQRLHLTQARVEQNLQRIDELKAEASSLERLSAATEVAEEAAVRLPALQLAAAGGSARSRQGEQQGAGPSFSGGAPSSTAPGTHSLQDRGLRSSLEMEEGLREHWYPAHFSSGLKKDALLAVELFGEPWVLFRDEAGLAACVKDECAHRACPLSLGKVTGGQVQCPYHGWEYNGAGQCTRMPSTLQCPGISVTALPCTEKDGFVWVWPGRGLPGEVPACTPPPRGYTIHAEIEVEVPVEHGLLLENLLDLAHAPFTHTSTFAKGWPVPDFVRFRAAQLLEGSWDPYPIDMAFQPPCCVLSNIGLTQPGKIQRGAKAEACRRHLHQLHVCLPSRRGHTRLLYRMSLDFMDWTRHVPGIQAFWRHIAGQVLGEDLVLVSGQQERMQRGADTWAHPVSYDKLAVRYRRWRNAVSGHGGATPQGPISMSAGELFTVDDDDDSNWVQGSGS